MNISKKNLKKEYQNFLDTLSQEEYQNFLNAKSQDDFPDTETREKYIRFLNAKCKVLFFDEKLDEIYHGELPDVKIFFFDLINYLNALKRKLTGALLNKSYLNAYWI